eukprot:jgi/Chrzof1/9614/Cz04g09220.t1
MPQKPLLKAGKKIDKKQAANRHGKTPKTRKGHFDIAPKQPRLQADYKAARELTKAINQNNESNAAGLAAQAGGKMSVVR